MSPPPGQPIRRRVVGAASKQGRSVAHALLDSGRYRVRALTRRRDSEPAQVLAQRGAEVVVVPLQPSMQAELTAAMRGSAGAFLMTPPIVKMPPADDEFTLGQELANAAVAAGVEHMVFSGLENVEARTGGTKWAPHFTDKARVEAYIRSLPIRSSFVYLAFFYTNIMEYYVPQRGADGLTLAIYLPPNVRMLFVDPLTATGPAVREMFDQRRHIELRDLGSGALAAQRTSTKRSGLVSGGAFFALLLASWEKLRPALTPT